MLRSNLLPMKHFTLCCLLLFTSMAGVRAQSDFDRIIAALPFATDSCELYAPLLTEYLVAFDDENMPLSARLAGVLAQVHSACPNHEAGSMLWQGHHKYVSESDTLPLWELLQEVQKGSDSAEIVRASYAFALVMTSEGEHLRSAAITQSLLPYWRTRKNDEMLTKYYATLAQEYGSAWEMHKVTDYAYPGLEAFARVDSPTVSTIESASYIYQSLAQVYFQRGELEEALACARNVLQLAYRSESAPNISAGYAHVASALRRMDQEEHAAACLDSALQFVDTNTWRGRLEYARVSHTMAGLYYGMGALEAALPHAAACAHIFRPDDRDYEKNTAIGETMLGFIQAELMHPDAEKTLLSAHKVLRGSGAYNELESVGTNLMQLYIKQGRATEAIGWYDSCVVYRDTLYAASQMAAVADARTKFETEQTEQSLENAEEQLAMTELLARERQQRVWMMGIGLAVALLLGFLALRAYIGKRKANRLLEEQKQAIAAQNEEKAILLKEIHHRVKNNLQVVSSLLQLQSDELSDEAALAAVQVGRARVKSIAMIHEKLYQNEALSRVDFQDYLEQLVQSIADAFESGTPVERSIDAGNVMLDIDTAIPLGLILNELISNAYKYGLKESAAAKLQVKLSKNSSGAYELEVADNGSGVPAGVDLRHVRSLGMQLVDGLTRQLKGTWEYAYRDGAVFSITFQEKAMA